MKRFVALAVLVVVVAAFLAGYWPQHQRAVALEGELAALRARVTELEARRRAAALLGDLLNVIDAAARKDYGQAQQLSSAFFDHVRAETTDSGVPDMKSGLTSILADRDSITGALARTDPLVLEKLQQLQVQLRLVLGYPAAGSAHAS